MTSKVILFFCFDWSGPLPVLLELRHGDAGGDFLDGAGVAGADKEDVVGVNDEIVTEPAEGDEFSFLGRCDYRSTGVLKEGLAGIGQVPVLVFPGEGEEAVPVPDVVPSEPGGVEPGVVRLFEDSVVEGYLRTVGVRFLDEGGFVRGSDMLLPAGKEACHFGDMLLELAPDSLCGPDVNT